MNDVAAGRSLEVNIPPPIDGRLRTNLHDHGTPAWRDEQYTDVDWTVLPFDAKRTGFEAPSGRLAMVTMGNPTHPPVVLVPGVTGSKEDFALMMAELRDAGLYVISYDLAGQYESAGAGPENTTPPRKKYDYPLFVDDFIAVLESIGRPAHVLGYSFAGIVAQLAHGKRPELFSSLTFLSCPPMPGQTFRSMRRLGWLTHLIGGRAGAALMVWGIKNNFTNVPASRLDFVMHRFVHTRRSSVRDVIRLMRRTPDVRDQLARSPIPKLVAVGAHDLWSHSLHRSFARAIGAQFALYRSGHSPCETSPHQLNRDLLAHFAKATPAVASPPNS